MTQAKTWRRDPFSVADSSYIVHGKLGYEGKLVAGLCNQYLSRRLNYRYSGQGENLKCVVFGTIKGESEERTIEIELKKARTENAMWASDPRQKLGYSGAIKWARRHLPEIVTGCKFEDDIDAIAAEQEPIESSQLRDLIDSEKEGVKPDGELFSKGSPTAQDI